ncbi:hypothetical protein EDD66_10986 [Mobilisporobacter senegalensis]|uniref:Uncharacterized protein n=1 Tax=Mobilisporobacter senegalensis TaxID=1329262 RepID=A0A3N1XGN6_9FIRM|nr:hypothetical protein [Mobilisporobacter senegalensis]ROR25876.1 hypothetical protein EDD66_10986 [Mobilisporobacter senegalensis]
MKIKIDLGLSQIKNNIIVDFKASSIKHFDVDIDLDDNTSLKITQDYIIIESITKSEFLKGFDQMKKLLIIILLGNA